MKSNSNPESCEICKKAALKKSDLISACNCNKKREDRGRVHESCLIKLIRENDAESGIPTCPLCKQPYQIVVKKNFHIVTEKLFSLKSLTLIYKIAITIVCLISFAATLSSLRQDFSDDLQGQRLLIFASFFIFVIMLSNLYSAVQQWKSFNSDIKLSMN